MEFPIEGFILVVMIVCVRRKFQFLVLD